MYERKKIMREMLRYDPRAELHSRSAILANRMTVGLIGGLVGTIVMDLFGFGVLLVMGGPETISFTLIGDAAAAFFSANGIDIAGGAPLGVALHYLIGLALGISFAAILLRIDALHLASLKKGIALGILYVELMSLPMLATAALVLKMTALETAQYFGTSFVMHLVFGSVLGLVVSYNLISRSRSWRADRVPDFRDITSLVHLKDLLGDFRDSIVAAPIINRIVTRDRGGNKV